MSTGLGIVETMASMLSVASSDGDAQPSSAALALRAQRGDRDALSRLLTLHASSVQRLCHHLLGSADGLDAAQEALERMVRRLDTFDPERGTFRTWALGVTRNLCRDRMRRLGLERAAFASEAEPALDSAFTKEPSPERLALARIGVEDLSRALASLPEGMRSAIVLFHAEGASYEEIARILAVPVGTVMTWLHRGRLRLRANLEEA